MTTDSSRTTSILSNLLEKNNLSDLDPNAPILTMIDPCTGDVLGKRKVDGPKAVETAVQRSRKAQQQWAKSSFDQRRKVFRSLLKYIINHQKEICELSARDSGKTITDAQMGELFPVCEKIRWHILHGERYLRPEERADSFLVHKVGWVEYAPLGVCGIICPWNFPFHNIFCPLLPVLFAGNGAVVKVSEHTTYSMAPYASIIHRILEKHGYSKDLVQFITGFGPTGAALVSSSVDKIFFTGSPQNGRKVMANASKTLKPVVLELGGKDPMIILDDADFEQAVSSALLGTVTSSGQMCVSAERIYVHESLYEKFIYRLQEILGEITQGPTLDRNGNATSCDVGCLTMKHQVTIIQNLVDDAVSKGARLICGGKINPKFPNSQFYQPTLLVDVTHDMKIMSEEHFGPILVVAKFSSEEEAIKLANDCPYGLGGSIFSKDLKRAHRLAQQLSTGMVVINDYGIAYMFQDLPFGGVRISGLGKINGPEGLRSCCLIKSIVTDRIPGVRVSVLKAFQYPIDSKNAFPMAESMIKLIYSDKTLSKPAHASRFLSHLASNTLSSTSKPQRSRKSARL